MAYRSSFMKIGNSFIEMLLRSPFHPMMSENTLLVTVQGKKRGFIQSLLWASLYHLQDEKVGTHTWPKKILKSS